MPLAGLTKIVINHLEKVFVTADCATILSELEVNHPAAKLLSIAAAAQDKEFGDGSNLVLAIAGELLGKAEGLIREGLHPNDIARGYDRALEAILGFLDELVLPAEETALNLGDEPTVAKAMAGVISSKQQGYEDFLGGLVAKACIGCCPNDRTGFNVDNIRVAKAIGGSIHDSFVVNGVVMQRDSEGSVKQVSNAKVAVFAQGVDTSGTETKGTVLIHNAEELLQYHESEEQHLAKLVKSIADAGVKLVISGSAVGELAMHFLERHGIMVVKVPSKFELRRICQTTGATALPRFGVPQPQDLGHIKDAGVREVGGSRLIVFQQSGDAGRISTIVLRGATRAHLDDIERAIDDGCNTYKALVRDTRRLPAGGATEMQLSVRLAADAKKQGGLEQYTLRKFSEALEIIPRTICDNTGLDATGLLSKMQQAHAAPEGAVLGVDTMSGDLADLSQQGISDLYAPKVWGLKLATDAATTVLQIDQIIMSKQAGGKKQ